MVLQLSEVEDKGNFFFLFNLEIFFSIYFYSLEANYFTIL